MKTVVLSYKSAVGKVCRYLTITSLALIIGQPRFLGAAESPLPAGQIPLDSEAGIRLLEESGARASFYSLIQHLAWQQTPTYCGVASAVTVLNTLHPTNTPLCATLGGKIAIFDQQNFFTPRVEQVVAQSVVAKQGFTLDEWTRAVGSYGLKTEAFHCGDASGLTGFTEFLDRAKKTLARKDQFLVVNFERKAMGQAGKTGHFSPVGAYNEQENKFLVLEVAIFKYPVYWVDAELLWKAMSTQDRVSQKNRGFVIVSQNAN